MKNQCPVCGENDYEEYEGDYDIPDESGAKKLSPDTGNCNNCGFDYSEHINHPFSEQVKDIKKIINSLKSQEGK